MDVSAFTENVSPYIPAKRQNPRPVRKGVRVGLATGRGQDRGLDSKSGRQAIKAHRLTNRLLRQGSNRLFHVKHCITAYQ